MSDILKILTELFKIFRRAFSEAKKNQNEKEISDVKDAIKKTDINKLRNEILDRGKE